MGPQFGCYKDRAGNGGTEKTGGILWAAETSDYTNDALMVFDSLINWATNNKANARVGFFPSPLGLGAVDLRDRLVAAGHTVTDIPDVASIPTADMLDLLIHSNELEPIPQTVFSNYNVPNASRPVCH